MAQLTCQKLCVGYDGRPVLQGLDFEAFAGDYLCIVGENGSGKSTLMKTILGLQTPISGSILTGDGLRKNEIGYLPQQTQVQKDFPASVREIVLSGCQGLSLIHISDHDKDALFYDAPAGGRAGRCHAVLCNLSCGRSRS